MPRKFERVLFWLPRGLGILFTLFVSMFALDVFTEGVTWRALGGFLIHLIPVYLLLLVLILAWRWEWIGVGMYPLLAFAYMVSMPDFPISVYVILTGPLFLLSLLFLLHRLTIRKELAG